VLDLSILFCSLAFLRDQENLLLRSSFLFWRFFFFDLSDFFFLFSKRG